MSSLQEATQHPCPIVLYESIQAPGCMFSVYCFTWGLVFPSGRRLLLIQLSPSDQRLTRRYVGSCNEACTSLCVSFLCCTVVSFKLKVANMPCCAPRSEESMKQKGGNSIYIYIQIEKKMMQIAFIYCIIYISLIFKSGSHVITSRIILEMIANKSVKCHCDKPLPLYPPTP